MKIPVLQSKGDVEIYNLGDLHYGNKAFRYELLRKVVDRIKDDDRAYWLSTGDLFEVALVGTLGDPYTAMSPNKEFYYLKDDIEPIKDKCLGIVKSNHSHRFEKLTSMSMDKLFVESLGIGDKYLGSIGVVRVMADGIPYDICLHHGIGGGRTKGAKINNLVRLGNVVSGCDVYMSGHTHTYISTFRKNYYLDKKRKNFQKYKALYVSTGHFMEYLDSYGVDKMYEPEPIGIAKVKLKAGKKGSGQLSVKKMSADFFTI